MFELIDQYTRFTLLVGSTLIGGIVWLTKLHLDVLQNRKLRESDKQELIKEFETEKQALLKELDRIAKRVEKVEADNSQTLTVLTEIKVQLSAIETTLKLFFKNK